MRCSARCSRSRVRPSLPRKVTVEPVDLRNEKAFQFTSQLADRVIHDNLGADEARERVGLLLADYGQGLLQTADADWQVLGETVLRRPPTRTAAPRDARPAQAVPARGRHTRAVPRRARRDDAGRQGAEQPLRQVPPGQPLPRAGRRRRPFTPDRWDAPRGRLRLRQVVSHLRDPPSADRAARP